MFTANHTVSPDNPTYVTGSDNYRISSSGILRPDHPHFEQMQEFFKPEHRRPDGHGLAFLESQEHSLTYTGPVEQLEEARRNPGRALDTSPGDLYGFWPHGTGWDDFIPKATWNPDGQGIVTEFAHRDSSVVVFEFLEQTEAGEQVSRIAFHCLRCHTSNDRFVDTVSDGPEKRRWIAADARKHARPSGHCVPKNPRFAEVVTAVANDMYGTNSPVVTAESRCATEGACSTIRHLRARAATSADGNP